MADKRFPIGTPSSAERDASNVKQTVAAPAPVVSWTDRFEGREEPHLQELIDDPIMTCLLNSDGLTAEYVLDVVRKAKARKNETVIS